MRYFMFTFLLSWGGLSAQIVPPYFNDFETAPDTVGWTHTSLNGLGEWGWGQPAGPFLNGAFSGLRAWSTDSTGEVSPNTDQVLETPPFDLSQTSDPLVLSFWQKRDFATGMNFWLEYSLDSGQSWPVLNPGGAELLNWQSNQGWVGNSVLNYTYSAHSIQFLQGNSDVRFRFRVSSASSLAEGWIIDDFYLGKEMFNVSTQAGQDLFASLMCDSINVSYLFGYESPYLASRQMSSYYFLSQDSLLDISDSLFYSPVISISETDSNYTQSIPLPAGLVSPGQPAYVIWLLDALNEVPEVSDNDNIGYARLEVDSVRSLPHHDDFEGVSAWRTAVSFPDQAPVWSRGAGYTHHLEKAHSGDQAWHTAATHGLNGLIPAASLSEQYLLSPFFDLGTLIDTLVVAFWYKGLTDPTQEIQLQVTQNCGQNWVSLGNIPPPRDDDWDSYVYNLGGINIGNNVQFRIRYTNTPAFPEGLIIDDVFIGSEAADLSIERIDMGRSLNAGEAADTLLYYLTNAGIKPAPASKTAFFWSNDSILDAGDSFLAIQAEPGLGDTARLWRELAFTKPTQLPGDYYIFYQIDSTTTVDEMREQNNVGYIPVHIAPRQGIPYTNDFESQANGWRHQASLGQDVWEWAVPAGLVLDAAFSGQKAWITQSGGPLPGLSRMHLLSPVFDLGQAQSPVLHFRAGLDYDPLNSSGEGRANVSYSLDGGASWNLIDTVDQSFNRLYYPVQYAFGQDQLSNQPRLSSLMFDLEEPAFLTSRDYNGRDARSTSYFNVHLPQLAGEPSVQFRFNVVSNRNPDLAPLDQSEGLLIDDVFLEEGRPDLTVDDTKVLLISPLNPSVSFFMDVENKGNLAPRPSSIDFYLSADSLLDVADFWIGRDSIGPVRPDYAWHLNEQLSAPQNLDPWHYVLAVIDPDNLVAESNEDNNVAAWPLGLDGIGLFPYQDDFAAPVIDGWYSYAIDPFAPQTLSPYRMRHQLAPAEETGTSGKLSGQWFTDFTEGNAGPLPRWFLRSPKLDFSRYDSAYLSFDLLCIGRTDAPEADGGNLSYSLDGGNSWQVLTAQQGLAYNWYAYDSLNLLDNEPGWSGSAGPEILDSTAIDLRFLRGQSEVMFEFKYQSHTRYDPSSSLEGFRLDNWQVEGFTVDYRALDTLVQLAVFDEIDALKIGYRLDNTGSMAGKISQTRFYWSEDANWDMGDSLLTTVSQPGLDAGALFADSLNLDLPDLTGLSGGYILYVCDADSQIVEWEEGNNVGRIELIISVNGITDLADKGFQLGQESGQYTLHYKDMMAGKSVSLELLDLQGRAVWTDAFQTTASDRRLLAFPESLAQGVYSLKILSGQAIVSMKVWVD